jgi:WD40 repeat protein
MCVTGSWDKSIRFWDLRTPTAQLTVQVCLFMIAFVWL